MSINFLNASMILDKNSPVCIENFYYKNAYIYYQRSSNLSWYSTSEDHTSDHIKYNFVYDSDNDTCSPAGVNSLGLLPTQFNFLLALCGLIFGAVFLFFTVDAFVKVGGKK